MSYIDDLNGQLFSLGIQQSNITSEIFELNIRRDEVQRIKDDSMNCVDQNYHSVNGSSDQLFNGLYSAIRGINSINQILDAMSYDRENHWNCDSDLCNSITQMQNEINRINARLGELEGELNRVRSGIEWTENEKRNEEIRIAIEEENRRKEEEKKRKEAEDLKKLYEYLKKNNIK